LHPVVTAPANIFESLLALSRQLSDSLALEPYLQSIIEHTCQLVDSEVGSILLYEEESGLLKFVAIPPTQSQILKRLRVPLECSIAGQAYTQAQPIIVQNGNDKGDIFREVDRALNFKSRSILAVPVIYRGNTLGVLEAVNKRNNANYTGDDVTILETLATYAAIAIFSSTLLDEANEAYEYMKDFERQKADFIAITSHELRTPLGLILGHAAFLHELPQDDRTRQQLNVIIHSANRLKKIFNDISNINNNKKGLTKIKWQRVSINKLIGDVCQSFVSRAQEKNISLTHNVPERDLTARMDIEKIDIAISNLIENAITYSSQGGHVLVTAEELPGYVKISVIDDGIGIPAKDLNKVFEQFYQVQSHTTRCHGGMGLGLSVAKVMVEIHGGQIWVESVLGKGSNFSILLPTNYQPETKKGSTATQIKTDNYHSN
jgi:signal transduction histidine kinase